MSSKRTYINLINDFWDSDAQEPFSAPVTRVYFYLLNRINRNRWEPVFISDVELAEATGASRRRLPEYRQELNARGFIKFEQKGTGRQAGTFYGLHLETAPKGTINCAERNNLDKTNCAQRSSLINETAPKGTVNCAQRNSLDPSAPINISLKTSLRPSTTTEDMRASALAHTRDVAAVEVEAVEVLEIKKEDRIAGAADLLLEKKRRAQEQADEVLKAFFDETNRRTLETLCMQNRVDFQQLRAIAERIAAEWIQDGRCHDDYKGRFDISDAIRHLRMTIPKKATAEARAAAAPKSRQQARQDLMAASYAHLQAALNAPFDEPQDTNPF